ncbi:hypothetical protein IU421_14790 [Nocardia cyriacigeorgica]|uniref:hypothetical protein n=1 Tax=Nocardia cyriacigeorgica TaxID=135487 RepID=UPI0018945C35|nr:hypothetical protein [Nocardia cyriacigeorgica]MBF6515537.1 hypothetical protein [Nocardia cyriacigeorgica]
MPAQRFRKKPVEVEAIRWTGSNVNELFRFTNGKFAAIEPDDREGDPEKTGEVLDVLHATWVGVYTGQWIIKGVKGEFYPCDDEVLAETYDAIL